MHELTLAAPGVVRWAATAEPVLQNDHAALVRPLVAATCDFDHLMVSGRVPLGFPVALGHEAVAVVLEVGGEVTSVRPGDRVVVPFQISCGRCSRCRAGLTSACEAVGWLSAFGLGKAGGGFGGLVSDVVAVPYADGMLVPLPDDVDQVTAASLSCNIVDAYRCVAPHLRGRPGARVLVFGGAFDNIALYAAKIAEAEGAGEVVLVAEGRSLQARAAEAGVRFVTEWSRTLDHFDITVDASMQPRLLLQAVEATAPGGTLTISTMYVGDKVEWPLMAMFERCLTVSTGQPHARALSEDALTLLRRGAHLGSITTGTLAWSEAPAAFSMGSGKWVLTRA